MKKNYKILLWYFSSIVGFGFIYFGFWMCNTSYFMVSEEYNQQTIPLAVTIPDLPSNFYKSEEKSVLQVNQEITKAFLYIDSLNKIKVQNDSLATQLEKRGKTLNDALWNSYETNLDETVKMKTASIETRKAQLLAELDSIKKIDDVKSNTNTILIQANINVKIANLNLEEAKLKAELYNKSNETYFDKELYLANKKIGDSSYALYEVKSDILESILNKQIEISNLTIRYHVPRLNRLNVVDFMYFSAGAATSSNFGDILPNHTWIRVLIILQIIGSVIAFGYFVNEAIDAIKKAGSQNNNQT